MSESIVEYSECSQNPFLIPVFFKQSQNNSHQKRLASMKRACDEAARSQARLREAAVNESLLGRLPSSNTAPRNPRASTSKNDIDRAAQEALQDPEIMKMCCREMFSVVTSALACHSHRAPAYVLDKLRSQIPAQSQTAKNVKVFFFAFICGITYLPNLSICP